MSDRKSGSKRRKLSQNEGGNFSNRREERNNNERALVELNGERSVQMFRLNIDCFDEIFDYLSMEDLYSLGETCTRMQQIAGQYFKSHYSNATTFSMAHKMCTIHWHDNGWVKGQADTMCFIKFITYLVIGSHGE